MSKVKGPVIQSTEFGEITIDDETYTKDLYIYPDGTIKKRKKKLAKEVYGTSHKVGPRELKKICKEKPSMLIIGAGQQGVLELTAEGRDFLKKKGVDFRVAPTSEAIRLYNEARGKKALLVHLTC
jgi:hypothetical protein